MPLGEADRLLTILTKEHGLVRAVAAGSRKHNSRLTGRSALFVVNDLLIAKGRSLDRIAQVETLESYPGLAQNLKKLTASQYLAELCLHQALSEQPQEDLFFLLNEHLAQLERSHPDQVLPCLIRAIFQLLILAGVAPQVHYCCLTNQPLTPDFTDTEWRTGFSSPVGGAVMVEAWEQLQQQQRAARLLRPIPKAVAQTERSHYQVTASAPSFPQPSSRRSAPETYSQLTATELAVLQQLAIADLSPFNPANPSPSLHNSVSDQAWLALERVLRHHAQYHFDRPIRSATLIDDCFRPLSTPAIQHHDSKPV